MADELLVAIEGIQDAISETCPLLPIDIFENFNDEHVFVVRELHTSQTRLVRNVSWAKIVLVIYYRKYVTLTAATVKVKAGAFGKFA